MSWIKDKSWKDRKLTPEEKDKSLKQVEACKKVLMGLAFVMSQSLSEKDVSLLKDMPDKITEFVEADLKAKGFSAIAIEAAKTMLSATWAFSSLSGLQRSVAKHEKGEDCGKTE